MTWWTRDPDRWIDLPDCSLPTWREGSGPDLVFSHGWPLDSRTWRGVVSVLREHFTCHLVDLPGTGQSRWDEHTRAGLRENADALAAVVDALGLERYGLLGHDSGGVSTRLLAARDGDRVFGQVLGNTEIPGHHSWMLTALVATMKLPGARAGLRLMVGSKALRRLPMIFGGGFDDVSLSDAGEFHDFFVRPLLESDRAYAGQKLLAMGLDPRVIAGLAQSHGRTTAPTLLLWGQGDPWFPLKHAEPMVAQFAGPAELRPLPGKLLAHEEHAEAWARQASGFLQQAWSERSQLAAAS